jgi:hypothetical protein
MRPRLPKIWRQAETTARSLRLGNISGKRDVQLSTTRVKKKA